MKSTLPAPIMVNALSTSPGELLRVTLLRDVVFFKFVVLPFAFVGFLLGCDFGENKPKKGLGNITQRSIKYARHEKTNVVAPRTNAIYCWKAESVRCTTIWLICRKKPRHTMY